MSIYTILNKIVPRSVVRFERYYFSYNVPAQKRKYKKIVERVSQSNHANVMFIVSTMSMWRCQGLSELLKEDARFSVKVVVYPFSNYDDDSREREYKIAEEHFLKQDVDFQSVQTSEEYIRMKKEFRPDIIFYPQPYDGLYGNALEWEQNRDCLLAYEPYCLAMSVQWIGYNMKFHNLAWKHYQPSELHIAQARTVAFNKGENLVCVGEPRADDFSDSVEKSPWKKIDDGKARKRVIWAPHFQIFNRGYVNRPEFLWASQRMVDIAKKYEDVLQIAFKPHPKLRTSLYNHPDWGKEKTDRHYQLWEEMANTQIADGEYVDLFKTSDAMIHNCGSFSAEYLYARKPVAYLTQNEENVRHYLNEFGNKCIDCHYLLQSEDAIDDFVKNVVLGGNDTLKELRNKVYEEQMRPPKGVSVAENIYNDLVESLHLS